MKFSNRLKSLLLVGGAVATMTFAPAAAQAQEDVQALKNQVQQLMARIQKLESTQAAAPAAAPAVKAASAPVPVINAIPQMEFRLGGWVNRAVTYGNNGADDDFLFVDNNGASSRITATGTGKINDVWSAGAVFELEAVSHDARGWGLKSQGAASANFRWQERKMEAWFEHKQFGRVWVGQGDMASNFMSEVDLSRTAHLGTYSDIGATFGGLQFVPEGTDVTPANATTVQGALQNFDGLNRDDRLRYDTASLGGFVGSVSFSDGGDGDMALRYVGKFGTTDVAATVAYVIYDDGGTFDDLLGGSASVRLANGLNFTAATATRDATADGRDSASFWYTKLGYVAKLAKVGDTAFAIDYYDGEDLLANDAETSAYSFSVVQYLNPISSELYFSIRNHTLEVPGTEYEDVLGVMTGARVKF